MATSAWYQMLLMMLLLLLLGLGDKSRFLLLTTRHGDRASLRFIDRCREA